jgi:hypothetical protein
MEEPARLSLNDFPVPFVVEGAIQAVPFVMVLPDEPGSAELNAQ